MLFLRSLLDNQTKFYRGATATLWAVGRHRALDTRRFTRLKHLFFSTTSETEEISNIANHHVGFEEEKLPPHARVVVCGGGLLGSSVAYHLALAGWTDIILLDQGR